MALSDKCSQALFSARHDKVCTFENAVASLTASASLPCLGEAFSDDKGEEAEEEEEEEEEEEDDDGDDDEEDEEEDDPKSAEGFSKDEAPFM